MLEPATGFFLPGPENISSSIEELRFKMREDYVELLRSELKTIRRKVLDSTRTGTVCSIDTKREQSNALKHYEGMEYLVREVVRNLEMGRDPDEIQATLQLNEARFNKIIQSRSGQPFLWRYYAKGVLEGVGIVRELMS
jgi:hypothetical protein